jgi:hypothetical protein
MRTMIALLLLIALYPSTLVAAEKPRVFVLNLPILKTSLTMRCRWYVF